MAKEKANTSATTSNAKKRSPKNLEITKSEEGKKALLEVLFDDLAALEKAGFEVDLGYLPKSVGGKTNKIMAIATRILPPDGDVMGYNDGGKFVYNGEIVE